MYSVSFIIFKTLILWGDKIQILKETEVSKEDVCPYFPDRKSKNKFMFATDLNRDEFGKLLSKGWRRFGIYYFRPFCDNCRLCIPIRVPVKYHLLSKSQKRVFKKNKDTKVVLRELSYRDEVYDIYRDHSERFNQETTKDNFIQTFYLGTAPAYQTEYYVDGKLAAVGFLDSGNNGMSSVYFVYRKQYSHLSLGTFGAIREIEIVRELEMDYYYLGYYIEDNLHMNYKAFFKPYELYNWEKKAWSLYGK